jgi:hypothetical protein
VTSETKTFTIIAVIGWFITAAATVDMALGNPTAINGVIGAGFGATVFTLTAWGMWRQDRRP